MSCDVFLCLKLTLTFINNCVCVCLCGCVCVCVCVCLCVLVGGSLYNKFICNTKMKYYYFSS